MPLDEATSRQKGVEWRKRMRLGETSAQIAKKDKVQKPIVDAMVAWAERNVPWDESEVLSARALEIHRIDVQQQLLQSIWDGLQPYMRTLQTFARMNKEFLALSKARRELGGLDSPVKSIVDSTITLVTEAEQASIDDEVKALTARLALNDPKITS